MRKTLLSAAACAGLFYATAGHAGPPQVLLPESQAYLQVARGTAVSQRPRIDMETAIDRLMPELVDLAFVNMIRDYHRASLAPENMGPGDLMRLRLAQRHTPVMVSHDPQRIREMAQIDMVEQYRPELAMEIRTGNYDLGPDSLLNGDLGTAADLEAFLATKDGMEMVSTMSESQFKALTLLLREMKAEDLRLTGTAERTVGDGANLAFRGWRVDYDGSEVRVYHETTPGSGLIVEAGMVMGEFGRVTDIQIDGQDVAISFETGETLSSRSSDLLANGIPALGDNLTQSAARSVTPASLPVGEIIMTRRTDPVASLSQSGSAPMTSLRPVSRPAALN